MTIKPLIILPDPVLRQTSKPVETVDDQVRRLADDMLETMYDAPGIGLAAMPLPDGFDARIACALVCGYGTAHHALKQRAALKPGETLLVLGAAGATGLAAIQIGEPLRMMVIDVSKEEEENAPRIFLNPEILTTSDAVSVYEEGCLSIPDYYAEVERPAEVTVRYLGLDGKMHEETADGILATCVQHELDHLNGVLFIDHISKLKRDMVVKKFTKAARRTA